MCCRSQTDRVPFVAFGLIQDLPDTWTAVFQALSYLPLVWFPDSNGPLEVPAWPPFGLLLFGLTFEGKSLLELLRNVKGIEMSGLPGNLLKEKSGNSDIIKRVQ